MLETVSLHCNFCVVTGEEKHLTRVMNQWGGLLPGNTTNGGDFSESQHTFM